MARLVARVAWMCGGCLGDLSQISFPCYRTAGLQTVCFSERGYAFCREEAYCGLQADSHWSSTPRRCCCDWICFSWVTMPSTTSRSRVRLPGAFTDRLCGADTLNCCLTAGCRAICNEGELSSFTPFHPCRWCRLVPFLTLPALRAPERQISACLRLACQSYWYVSLIVWIQQACLHFETLRRSVYSKWGIACSSSSTNWTRRTWTHRPSCAASFWVKLCSSLYRNSTTF